MPQQRLRFKTGRKIQDVRSRISRGSPTVRSTTFVQGTDHVQFNDGSFTVVGRDSHTHIHQHSHGAVVSLQSILAAIPNFRKIHQDMLAKATPGTGLWLLKGEKFSLWLEPNGDLKILWGSGIPGAGKTIIAALVIDILEAMARQSGYQICVAYVYIRYSDHTEMEVRSVFEILVKQIVERHPDGLPIVHELYAQHLSDETQPTELQLLGILQQLTDSVPTAFVLDAIDEAPMEIQLDLVKKLALLNCKIFITSRPLRAVEAHFPSAHRFAIIAQEGDIDLLIKQKLEKNADLQELLGKVEKSLREEILSTIKRNCGGMFLHASLQLDALCSCLSIHDVREALEQFPFEIEEVYAQTWRRILNQRPRHVILAKKLLLWVLSAQKSITIEALQRAVATSPESHHFEPARMVPESTLLGLCCGLVVFEEESRLVRLVHYTARGTIERLLLESFPDLHSHLAAVCMTRLTDCGFQNTIINSEEVLEQVLKDDPLLAYAHDSWAFHARSSLDDKAVASQLAKFVADCHAFPVLIYQRLDLLNPLHLVAHYELPLSLACLYNDGDGNSPTELGGHTAMALACIQGYDTGVRALLSSSGLSVNTLDKRGRSALMHAVYNGREEIVELLLSHPETAVNMVNDYGNSALLIAASEGYHYIVKLLLANPSVQANLVNKGGWSALTHAAFHGYTGIVELLLSHPKIEVNAANDFGETALMIAASNGDVAIVKPLLAHPDIDVNSVDGYGDSALMIAASGGQGKVVKLLLLCPEIQVNTANAHKRTSLVQAAANGNFNTVELLLGRCEIDANAADSHGSTALLLASEHGHKGIVGLLLVVPDIDVGPIDGDGDTPIKMAAQHGHEGIVKMLLAVPGIDINVASTKDGHTAISAAMANGHDGIIRLLQTFDAASTGASLHSLTPAKDAEQSESETKEQQVEDSDSDGSDLFEDALDMF